MKHIFALIYSNKTGFCEGAGSNLLDYVGVAATDKAGKHEA